MFAVLPLQMPVSSMAKINSTGLPHTIMIARPTNASAPKNRYVHFAPKRLAARLTPMPITRYPICCADIIQPPT